MEQRETIYILGSGAIGFPLAAYLTHSNRRVIAVRTSRSDVPAGHVLITLHSGTETLRCAVETISLDQLTQIHGIIVIASKAHANAVIAKHLVAKAATGPICILQNGLGVETPFLHAGFNAIYRCVLYFTSQARAEDTFTVRPVTASPLGVIRGSPSELERCVATLSSPEFPFRSEPQIEREVWKKAIANAVFNSICPLLEVDNGIFLRDPAIQALARELVGECVSLTERLDLGLTADELMAQILRISQASDGQLISTLQDLRSGRTTEIDVLNLEMARIAAALEPPLKLPQIELLGKLIALKSAQTRGHSG